MLLCMFDLYYESRKPATLKHVVLIRNLIVFNYTNNPILYCMYYISWLYMSYINCIFILLQA